MTDLSLQLDSGEVADVLSEASQLSVCVLASKGPHTTPELFTVAYGRLWCLTAATTLKAKLLANGGAVAVTATAGGRSIIAVGDAEVVDIARPVQGLLRPRTAMAAPGALTQFALRNAVELTGAVSDLFSGKLGSPLPPRRVGMSIVPRALAIIEADAVVGASGWDEAASSLSGPMSGDGDLDLLEQLPTSVRQLAAGGPATLGWTTTSGSPIALPAVWSEDQSAVTVLRPLFELAGGSPSARVSVTRDQWTGYGPSGKQGVMLRGSGSASHRGDSTVITVDVEGVTYWDGIETGQVKDD